VASHDLEELDKKPRGARKNKVEEIKLQLMWVARADLVCGGRGGAQQGLLVCARRRSCGGLCALPCERTCMHVGGLALLLVTAIKRMGCGALGFAVNM
jgi:hypothetical protein